MSNMKFKFAFIAAIVLISIWGIIGSSLNQGFLGIPTSMAELKANWAKNIRLGLDLKGGSQLVIQMQLQDAFKTEADSTIQRLRDDLAKSSIEYTDVNRNDPKSIQEADRIQINVSGVPATKAGVFRQLVNDNYGGVWTLTPVNSTDYRLNMKTTEAIKLRADALTQSMNTIEKKINGLGLAESSVQQRGGSGNEAEILIQLPGVDDPARIKQLIGTAAVLELFEVIGGPFGSREEVMSSKNGVLPLNSQILREAAAPNSTPAYWLLKRTPEITGRDLRDARPQQDQYGKWETMFVLTQDAARRFERFTGAHINDRLAIVLDKQVLSAPTIQAKIRDNGVITNMGGHDAASDLALNLRAGALPAGVEFLEERTVGPSLGSDSIRAGMISGIAGVIAVVIIMLMYYKKAGVNATLALVLNAIILIATLSYFEAVLTLPGIAGVILTIGMAVDSNVLIFERIREELRSGKAVLAAVDTGFNKALLTIIDTHVTTVVSCCILFLFGTGPVKGFAVTLVIGLVANVFTAVFVSRVIFDWELAGRRQVQALSI
jgi:preprotein translocase subunit SecD